MSKKNFTHDISSKTLNLLSVYFLQPFLTLWGLMLRPLDMTLLMVPLLYMGAIVLTVGIALVVVPRLFSDAKERSIATVAALIGNTGNLGIPLGIALFGVESVPYMTLINLMNVFVVYTLGVFFYSRGSFSVKESLLNIVKLPILWFALLAVVLNLLQVRLDGLIEATLMMGAYASMVIQLLLFGIYLYEAKIEPIAWRLSLWVMGMKFILLPASYLLFMLPFGVDARLSAMLFMELLMPLAVANINIASLYACKPQAVTMQVFISSLIFILFAPLLHLVTQW